MKKFDIHKLSKIYVKGFYSFLKRYKIELNRDSCYALFCYSIKQLCDLEATEYNSEIRKYSSKCIVNLKRLHGTPKDLSELSFEERLDLLSCCEVYFVACTSLGQVFSEEGQ